MKQDLKDFIVGSLIGIIIISLLCRVIEGHFPFESYFYPYQNVDYFGTDSFILETYYKGERTYYYGSLDEIEKIKTQELDRLVNLIDRLNEFNNK